LLAGKHGLNRAIEKAVQVAPTSAKGLAL
jgi:hypothetical protein